MTILDKINEQKKEEVFRAKSILSKAQLIESPNYLRKINSLVASLTDVKSSGIIAEFKRKSPSKGDIFVNADVQEVTEAYVMAGAAGLSVLTDFNFFGGQRKDLVNAREQNPHIPILRKDFIVDAYQLYEAKAWGADVILLIAASLSPDQITEFSAIAHEIGLEVLLEIHNEKELNDRPLTNIDIIGVNNRNLKNFAENTIQPSQDLADLIPTNKVKISESCISDPAAVLKLKQLGYQGFLIGENFMKTTKPGEALSDFIKNIQ